MDKKVEKFQKTVDLLHDTNLDIIENAENYTRFLRSAAWTYKYRFNDQVLIYAQKPEAKAVATLALWNKMGRYVNKGTKSISLLKDKEETGYIRLGHVFDISDTHGKGVYVWDYEKSMEDAVFQHLENEFDIEENIKEPVSLEMLCKIQEKVAYNQALTTGELRSGRVGIAGTDYVPKIPVEEEVKEQLSELLNNPYPVDRALNVMFWGMKSQLFFDGNKRTSMLAANKIMIENGCGIISIKVDDIAKFNEFLSEYYSTDNLGKVKDFVYDKCIQGIEYEKEVDLDL